MSEQNELVLAVYEVGQCFFQGWGVPKDKAMGVVSRTSFVTGANADPPLYRAISRPQRSLAIPTRNRISPSALQTVKVARKIKRPPLSGIVLL